MSTNSTTPEDAAKALRSFATKMRDMADAMEKADKMIYERLILGIPAEPPVWSIVTVDDELFVRARMGDWFIIGDGAPGPVSRSWREVCELGTPEVLAPESVKALRERVGFLANQRDRFRKAHDEMIEKYHAVCGERNAALSTLADVEEKAKEWAEKDDEVTALHSLTILNTTNRHGRELLHLLGANGDEPPALEAS